MHQAGSNHFTATNHGPAKLCISLSSSHLADPHGLFMLYGTMVTAILNKITENRNGEARRNLCQDLGNSKSVRFRGILTSSGETLCPELAVGLQDVDFQ